MGLDFTYNHPVSLYTTLFDAGMEGEGVVLDYFAGSGTTGHAIINLNREDGGRRKFILVEMAHYFDSVLLPRLKKGYIFPPNGEMANQGGWQQRMRLRIVPPG